MQTQWQIQFSLITKNRLIHPKVDTITGFEVVLAAGRLALEILLVQILWSRSKIISF